MACTIYKEKIGNTTGVSCQEHGVVGVFDRDNYDNDRQFNAAIKSAVDFHKKAYK